MRNPKLPVTYLFVPGNRPERFDKALAAGADAIVLDLEDAVSADDKSAARANVQRWAKQHSDAFARVVVRINDNATPWYAADLELFKLTGVRFAMLPKAETAMQVDAVLAALPEGGQVLPIIESAQGADNVDQVAGATGVQRLIFGTLDYGVDLDLSGDERGLAYAAARIAHASRGAGLASPVYGVTPAIDDDDQLLTDLAFGRAFGFGAKLCIHPRQVGVIRKAMLPTDAEVDWAKRVLLAAASAQGALQVDGKMVDRPVLLKARAILDRAAGDDE